jgi:hypothetical protein
MPSGTTVIVTSSQGDLAGQTSFTVPDTIVTNTPVSQSDLDNNISIKDARSKNTYGGHSISFTLRNDLDDEDLPNTATLEFTITSPRSVTSGGIFNVNLVL